MHSTKTSVRASLAAALHLGGMAAAAVTGSSQAREPYCSQTVTRDVVVVGGGAAGAHAAVWLRDHNKTVLVVEKSSQLGGHTAYYDDPVSGKTINVGVQAWMQYGDAFDFPARMNVSTSGSMSFTANNALYVDFRTGQPVADYVAPGTAEKVAALQKYLEVLQKYQGLLLPGYANFPEPDAIPEDLLMSFGALADKYGLAAAVPQIWDSTAQGLGDTIAVPALWVMQASTNPMIEALLGTAAAAVPASGRLYDLFASVAAFLGSDNVLYSTTISAAERRADGAGVWLWATTHSASGAETVTCIRAKRLLVAFEPTTENLQPFDLDANETAVFDQFGYSTVYAGILRHPSLQVNTSYSDRSAAAGSTNYTVFPVASQVGRIEYLGGTEDLFQFTAVGTEDETAEGMQARIAAAIDTMIAAGTLPASNGSLSFAHFANHGKMHPRLSADVLRSGLIQKQLALQGRRSTWFTGAAFSAPFSTVLWEYNKELLPSVIEGI